MARTKAAALQSGVLAACLLFLLSIVPIASNWLVGRAAWDQLHFHLPAILIFAQQLPTPDLVDYASATTPGYHLALACVARWTGLESVGLRFAGLTFSLLLAGLLAAWCAASTGRAKSGLVLCMPLLVSFYFYSSAVWLLPDNAGWLGVFAVLALLLRGRIDLRLWLVLGAMLALLVFVRQIHVWVLAPMIVAAWLDAKPLNPDLQASKPLSMAEVFGVVWPTGRSLAALATVLAVSAPAIAIIICLALLWGGLVPLRFQNFHNTQWSWAAPAFFCSLAAGLGLFFAGWWWAGFMTLVRDRRGVLASAILFGLLVAFIPETSYSFEKGRYGALWSLVQRMPEFNDRSVLMGLTAPMGSVVLASWLALFSMRDRWIFMAACAGFMAASSANSFVAQRYFEPMVLLLFALLASRTPRAEYTANARTQLLGPLILSIMMGGLTTYLLVRSSPVAQPDQPRGTMPFIAPGVLRAPDGTTP